MLRTLQGSPEGPRSPLRSAPRQSFYVLFYRHRNRACATFHRLARFNTTFSAQPGMDVVGPSPVVGTRCRPCCDHAIPGTLSYPRRSKLTRAS